jgi:hypothetical protein
MPPLDNVGVQELGVMVPPTLKLVLLAAKVAGAQAISRLATRPEVNLSMGNRPD